jgi:hypothetical protein
MNVVKNQCRDFHMVRYSRTVVQVWAAVKLRTKTLASLPVRVAARLHRSRVHKQGLLGSDPGCLLDRGPGRRPA